jgi:transposase
LGLPRWVGRAIGLDVHRDFCVVAICEDGVTRSAGRVPSTPEGIKALAESLLPTDRVALEVTGSCWEVARILEPYVQRVVVVSPDDTGITSARAKTDKLDARTLASFCGRAGLRRCGCRMTDAGSCVVDWLAAGQLTRSRTRVKNEIHACLQRRLQEKPPRSDLFGVKGRQWLALTRHRLAPTHNLTRLIDVDYPDAYRPCANTAHNRANRRQTGRPSPHEPVCGREQPTATDRSARNQPKRSPQPLDFHRSIKAARSGSLSA